MSIELNRDNILSGIIDIAREAGAIALAHTIDANSIRTKADNTPVTDADIKMDQLIRYRLSKLAPSIPIVSEEGHIDDYKIRSTYNYSWIVDPLDGTRHFMTEKDDYTVNIALVLDSIVQLSVVLAPAINSCYYAIRGEGAFVNCATGYKQIFCNKEKSEYLRIAISYGVEGPKTNSFLSNCGDYKITRLGSSLKSCLIAEGKIDVYPRFGKTSEWDTAAAQLIIEEAGGFIVDRQNKPLVYNKSNLLNPEFIAHAPWYKPIWPDIT